MGTERGSNKNGNHEHDTTAGIESKKARMIKSYPVRTACEQTKTENVEAKVGPRREASSMTMFLITKGQSPSKHFKDYKDV